MYIDIDIMDCFETIEKTGPNCRQEGKKLLCMCMNFEKTILEFFTGMLPLCYYPYIHTQTAKQRSSNLERTLGLYDIMSKVILVSIQSNSNETVKTDFLCFR